MDSITQFSDTFVIETNKLLDEFSALLLANEKAKEFSAADIGEMFRIIHTIKGSAGMMNLSALMALTHALEELFVLLKGDADISAGHAAVLFDLFFDSLDAIRGALNDFLKDGREQRSFDELIRRIIAFRDAGTEIRVLRIMLSQDCIMQNVRSFLIVSGLKGLCPALTYYPENLDSDPEASDKIRSNGLYISFPAAAADRLSEALSKEIYLDSVEPADAFPKAVDVPDEIKEDSNAASTDGVRGSGLVDNYVSIHLSKLEELHNLTSEMMLIQSKLLCNLNADQTSDDVNKLRRVCESLQSAVTSLRMIPISGLFQRLHRTVREAGRRLGRDIEFTASGSDVEIDKSIMDALAESLIQLVRNAAVHGIESSEERMSAGKPLMGRIEVTAGNAGTSVAITVRDDGRGISAGKVAASAKNIGLAAESGPDSMSELLKLIMQPGVTTNIQADEMSGRGVGLDVVRTSIEKLRGSITLETEVGTGTAFHLRIPQSLAVMDCICLGAGETVFLLPSLDVYTLLRSCSDDFIQCPDGHRLLRFRDYVLPLIDLGTFYGVGDNHADMNAGIFAIIEGEDNAAAIYADRLLGLYRAEIKPLPVLLDKLNVKSRGISGCTILSDGGIGFILDAETLLKLAGGGVKV